MTGDPLALSPKHKLAVGATYTLPLDESIGKLSIGGSVTYRTKMLSNYIDRANIFAPTINVLLIELRLFRSSDGHFRRIANTTRSYAVRCDAPNDPVRRPPCLFLPGAYAR